MAKSIEWPCVPGKVYEPTLVACNDKVTYSTEVVAYAIKHSVTLGRARTVIYRQKQTEYAKEAKSVATELYRDKVLTEYQYNLFMAAFGEG